MQKTITQLWLLVFLSFFILMFWPKPCTTTKPRNTQLKIPEHVSTSTSVTKTVRKIIRIRGMVSGKKDQKDRSMLMFKRRRNRKLRDRLLEKNYQKLYKARKYKKFLSKNKARNKNIDMREKENSREISSDKNTLKRMKSRHMISETTIMPAPRRSSRISAGTTRKPTHIKPEFNQNLNSSKMIQLKSAEANYVALRRNIKVKKSKVRPETATTKPESIKNLVDNMIDRLKRDLDHLLMFNENLLHFDKSIVKNAAKTKVEGFFKTLSSAIDSQTVNATEGLDDKKGKLEAASNILNVTEDISRTLASTLDVGSVTEIKLANISMAVMKRKLSDKTSSDWDSGDIKVTLPDQESIAENNSSVTVSFTSYHNLGSMMNAKKDIRSPVLSVNVVQNHNQNQKRSIPLSKPIEFLLHHKPFRKIRQRKCVYWDFKYAAWSKDGCYTLRGKSTSTRTACQCYHLTNFALTLEEEVEEEDVEVTEVSSTTIEFSTVPPIASKLKFGDKINPEEVNKPNEIAKNDKSEFKVYRVPTETSSNIITIEEDVINPADIFVINSVNADSFKYSNSKQALPLLNTRTFADSDYEYYWEEFEKQEQNKLLNELPSDFEKVQEYESLKISA